MFKFNAHKSNYLFSIWNRLSVMWLADESVTLFVSEINRSNRIRSIDLAPALYLMISSMESCIVVSVSLMISDDPVCPRAWERALLRIIIRDQSKPPIRMIHSSSGLENIQPLKLGHKRFAGRDMAGVVWGADMRFTLILNDRRWTHLLGGCANTLNS